MILTMLFTLTISFLSISNTYGGYKLIVNRKQGYYFNSTVLTLYNENPSNPDANTYSIIGDLNSNNEYEKYRGNDGKFQFKLIYTYPTIGRATDTLIWKQSSWLISQKITGFEPISIPTDTRCVNNLACKFQGEGVNSVTKERNSLLDGSASVSGNWWQAVGTVKQWNKGHGSPGHDGHAADTETLYIWDANDSTKTPSPTAAPSIATASSTASRRYKRYEGQNCPGTGTPADILSGFVGNAQQCIEKCDELDCDGFVRINSGSTMGYNGKCFFRNGLGSPANATTDDRDCYEPITTCNATDINTFNWDILTTQGPQAAGVLPPVVKDFSIDESDLSLNIEVKLQYFGNASADDQEEAKFGVTYVLDFEDYDSEQHAINEPGTCQNRNDDDFLGKDFVSDYWQYSLDPVKDIGTSDYLSYPPPMPESGSWSVTMDKNDTCGTIIYTGKFSWSDLRGCTQYGGGESYTNIITDDNWLNMTGTFYINLVSPFWYDQDFGYYRDYQLLNQPFVIAISSVINVLGSTGINLMTMSVISVYEQDETRRRLSSRDGYSDFKLIFLTECSDYLELNVDGAIGVTFDGSAFSNSQLSDNDFNISDSSENNGCINNKGFICSQLWQITATSIPCTDNSGRDFSGNYAVTFTPQCRSADEIGQDLVDDCNTFLANHPQLTTGDRVALSTDLVYKDEICDPIIFTIQFEAEMTFYDDNTFSSPVDDSKLFQVGEDTIYVQINVSFPSDTMNVFETELIQVHICTFNPLIDVENNYNDPNDITNFGCFVGDSNVRDTDYDKYFYQIYQSDPNNPANPTISLFDFTDPSSYSDNLQNAVRFSFKIPHEVARDTLYVMAEVEITLQELGRRRVLLNAGRRGSGQTANQIQHFVQKVGMKHGQEIIEQPNHDAHPQQPVIPHQPYQPLDAPVTAIPATYTVNLSSSWMMAIGGLLGLALTFNIIYMTYQNCCIGSQRGRVSFIPIIRKNKKGKYSKVNDVESEFNSDVPMFQNEVDELQ